jgi:hypothetical protein
MAIESLCPLINAMNVNGLNYPIKSHRITWSVIVHTCNPFPLGVWKGRVTSIQEFKTSLGKQEPVSKKDKWFNRLKKKPHTLYAAYKKCMSPLRTKIRWKQRVAKSYSIQMETQESRDNYTIIVGNINASFSAIGKSSRQNSSRIQQHIQMKQIYRWSPT